MAQPKGDPVEAEAVALPPGNSTLHAKYVDRSSTRTILRVVGVVGIVAGTVIELAPLASSSNDLSSLTTGLIVGGSLTAVSIIP